MRNAPPPAVAPPDQREGAVARRSRRSVFGSSEAVPRGWRGSGQRRSACRRCSRLRCLYRRPPRLITRWSSSAPRTPHVDGWRDRDRAHRRPRPRARHVSAHVRAARVVPAPLDRRVVHAVRIGVGSRPRDPLPTQLLTATSPSTRCAMKCAAPTRQSTSRSLVRKDATTIAPGCASNPRAAVDAWPHRQRGIRYALASTRHRVVVGDPPSRPGPYVVVRDLRTTGKELGENRASRADVRMAPHPRGRATGQDLGGRHASEVQRRREV